MRKITYLSLFSLIQIMALSLASAQTQVGIPIKNVRGFVLEFKEPFTEILMDVDAEDNNFSKEESVVISISPNSKFLDVKHNSIAPNLIRRGALVEINGERLGSAIMASEINLLINLEKWETSAKGYFEALDGDKAWIDGKSVRLAPGAFVRGDKEWKGKTFSSFNEMMLGSEVEVNKGVLKPDGIIYATDIETRPNLYTKNEKEMIESVQKRMLLPHSLAGGTGNVLGRSVKFVENLELQTYVTKIGYKVIPRYQKDLPKNDPGKITFRFMVIEDESFNAFALPDGSIFVNTGLLRQIKNEAQLAGILGHEIAHVTHEHARRTMEDSKRFWGALGFEVLGKILLGDLGQMVGQIGGQTMLNDAQRRKEDQADRVGLLYLYQAGYDPREAPKVWRTLSREIKENAVSNFLYSNHSMARQRLKNLNREIAYSFYDLDPSQVKIGEEDYAKVVGAFFGWAPKPEANLAFQNTSPKQTGTTALVNQPSTTKRSTGNNDGFNAFFAKFKKAVVSNNRIAIKNMMAETFEWALDGRATREEAIQNMDSMKLWTALRDAMLSQPEQCNPAECNNRSGYHVSSKTRNRIEILFERDANGEWRWSAILGD